MSKIIGLIFAIGISALAVAGGKPLANVPKYDGKFVWVKVGDLAPAVIKTLAHAKTIVIDVSFSKDVRLKKDASGNQWFTFILADQGTDWKWNQTSGSGGVKTAGGMIKAGKYSVSLPIAGLPKSVLADKKQTISLGPNTSGLDGSVAFSIDGIKGK